MWFYSTMYSVTRSDQPRNQNQNQEEGKGRKPRPDLQPQAGLLGPWKLPTPIVFWPGLNKFFSLFCLVPGVPIGDYKWATLAFIYLVLIYKLCRCCRARRIAVLCTHCTVIWSNRIEQIKTLIDHVEFGQSNFQWGVGGWDRVSNGMQMGTRTGVLLCTLEWSVFLPSGGFHCSSFILPGRLVDGGWVDDGWVGWEEGQGRVPALLVSVLTVQSTERCMDG
ncbi:hypothetical protein BO78DRAFT_469308 [Aspergillus sclerotiicarbonarius CBS 121057]|uniref:Uncharacterized protein n=1 Tax=Aspergillus sclerotiicarbonarius (strain CBS 121057 / IBT 28362) TaxID=1448318 RepID=A0A319EAW6_ASPSB|nr:hypothetical protein BO78DRAFT_469308 [Aspergillus sclerotiicarbonarius CBS 121057]